jgi:hypothetical protein
MKRTVFGVLLAMALLAFVAVAAGAEELTANSILAAQQSGAPADGIVAMVNNPANTIAMTAGDLVTLRNAGVPESVIAAIWARLPAPAPASLQPDDARLVDLVRLIKSGMSGSLITEQVRQSGREYNLSVNDLLYLKQNGAQESTIAALMATRAGAPATPTVAPSELVFDDLVFMRPTFLKKNRVGRLVLHDDTLRWEDRRNSKYNFSFQIAGLEKVWLRCDARSSGNFCYQINFKIVKGDSYQFRDSHLDSGSNAAAAHVLPAPQLRNAERERLSS